METLMLTLDTIAFVVVLYWSYRGEREPGQPELGPFRIRAAKPKPAPDTALAKRPARGR